MCFLHEKLQNKKNLTFFTGGRLKITPGVTLKFEHSIGMMIAGEIIAEGDLKGGKHCYLTWFKIFDKLVSVRVIFIFQKEISNAVY